MNSMLISTFGLVAALASAPSTTAPAVCAPPSAGTTTSLSARAQDEIARLVPDSAFAYVQVASLDELTRAFEHIRLLLPQEMAADLEPEHILAELIGSKVQREFLWRDRPMGVAVSFLAGMPLPVPTLILPVTDKPGYLAVVSQGQEPLRTAELGDYLALSRLPDYAPPAQVSALAQKMPKGLIAARVDLEKMLEVTREMIEMGLNTAEQEMEQAQDMLPEDPEINGSVDMVQAMVGGARDLLDSVQSFDLTLDMQGTRFRFDGALTVAADSSLVVPVAVEPVDLDSLVSLLDATGCIQILGALDWAELTSWTKELRGLALGSYPEPLRAKIEQLQGRFDEFAPLLSGGSGFSLGFGPDGLRMSGVLGSKEPALLLGKCRDLMTGLGLDDMGLHVDPPTERLLGSASITELRMHFDARKMAAIAMDGSPAQDPGPEAQMVFDTVFGKDGLRIALAPLARGLYIQANSDDARLQSALSTSTGPAPTSLLKTSRAALRGCNPACAVQFDVSRILLQIARMAEAGGLGSLDIPPELGEIAFDFEIYGGAVANVFKGGFATDLVELGEFIKRIGELESGDEPPPPDAPEPVETTDER